MFIKELVEKREDGNLYVDARKLHKWLGLKKKFTDWLKQNLFNECYGFIENTDFINLHLQGKIEGTNIKQWRNEYYLSLDTAKQLCMISKTEKGIEARRYFIQCEKQLHEMQINNVKAMAMLFTHKDKLKFTKETLYPILDQMGVLSKSKKRVHQIIKQSLIGKYENITMNNEFDTQDFINDYKQLAEKMKEKYKNYFVDKNQITIFDILEEN